MKYSKGEYVIIREGGKNVLGIVTGAKSILAINGIEGDDPRTIKFDPKYDLLAVLGKKPECGAKVLGVTIKTFHATKETGGFPTIHMFCDKSLQVNIEKAIKRTYKRLGEYDVDESVRRAEAMYIMQDSGKKQYAFKSSFKKEEWHDILTVYVKPDMLVEEITENMLLAFGASIYTHQLATSRRSKWILAFHRMKNVKNVGPDQLAEILDAFRTEGDARDVKNVIHEDTAEVSDFVFRHVAKVTGISIKEMQVLMTDDGTAMDKMWPKEIQVAHAREDLPKFAMSNVCSLFAYAYMMTMTKQNPGKTLTKLMYHTLKELV